MDFPSWHAKKHIQPIHRIQHNMAKTKNQTQLAELQIKGIEIINTSIKAPSNLNVPIAEFNFNINIESKVDASNKLVFVIVHIEIKNDDQSLVLGAFSASCIFEIANFEDVIIVKGDGHFDIPQVLIQTLNSISLSTTRGVMFSTFKGTFLHNAVLPIIDPKQLQVIDQRKRK